MSANLAVHPVFEAAPPVAPVLTSRTVRRPVTLALEDAPSTARLSFTHRAPAARLVPVQQWAGSLAIAAVEVLAGRRPVQQLTRWLDQEVYADLSRRAGLATRLRRRPPRYSHARLLALRAHSPRTGVHEISAVVQDEGRVRAVALRVTPFGDRWRAQALEIG